VVVFALRVANAVIQETSFPNSGSEITFHFARPEKSHLMNRIAFPSAISAVGVSRWK
jgi:hypothetical protein